MLVHPWAPILIALVGQGAPAEKASANVLPKWNREVVADQLAPIVARPPATGLLVYEVLPSSQAERVGLKVGDILTVYDGQPIETTGQLRELAIAAAKENRNNLFLIAKRGEKEIEAELDPAPLGVRLFSVKQGAGRSLWRPATPFQSTIRAALERQAGSLSYEMIRSKGKRVGWRRTYWGATADGHFTRIQEWSSEASAPSLREIALLHDGNTYLAPKAIRVLHQAKPVVEMVRQSDGSADRWIGRRMGIPVRAEAPTDLVSSHLVGLVCAGMPAKPGACLRISYLDDASTESAPFANIVCQGEDAGLTRFAVEVFGEIASQFWISAYGVVMRWERTEEGRQYQRCEKAQALEDFVESEQVFSPIQEPPRFEVAADRKAN